tara:strand:+ start:1678 stop:2151 length:474 start_codon:yes stop_codon:yes gene_type:complete
MKIFFIVLFIFSSVVISENAEVYVFSDKAKEKIYKELSEELRCLVCQNQSIADSNAELAKDMRQKTYELVKNGKNKREIATYMANRYGDFVLYKPPFKAKTAFLWIGPFVLFFAAIWFMLRAIKTRQLNNEESSLTEQQLKEASSILRVKEKDGPYE